MHRSLIDWHHLPQPIQPIHLFHLIPSSRRPHCRWERVHYQPKPSASLHHHVVNTQYIQQLASTTLSYFPLQFPFCQPTFSPTVITYTYLGVVPDPSPSQVAYQSSDAWPLPAAAAIYQPSHPLHAFTSDYKTGRSLSSFTRRPSQTWWKEIRTLPPGSSPSKFYEGSYHLPIPASCHVPPPLLSAVLGTWPYFPFCPHIRNSFDRSC